MPTLKKYKPITDRDFVINLCEAIKINPNQVRDLTLNINKYDVTTLDIEYILSEEELKDFYK